MKCNFGQREPHAIVHQLLLPPPVPSSKLAGMSTSTSLVLVWVVKRLKKAIYLADVSQHVTLLYNAMSDEHSLLSLGMDPRNPSDTYLQNSINCTEADRNRCLTTSVETITMDDLLPLMKSDRAIMKVGIQGAEIKLFNPATASKFFAAIQVPYIFLEWILYKPFYNDPKKKAEVDKWLEFFYSRNYTVHHQDWGNDLGRSWQTWSYNVIFKKPYESLGLI